MTSENVTNKNLLNELNKLNTQVQLLQERVSSQPSSLPQEKSVEFLLAEFNLLSELFRHTDARLESGINLSLTASAIIVSGLVILSQQVTNIRSFLISLMVVAFILAIGGLVLLARITSTSIIKAGYLKGLNVIRGYFANNDQLIKKYLVLPISDSTQPLGPVLSVGPFLIILQVWISLLVGLAVGIGGFLLNLLLAVNIGIAVLVTITLFVILRRATKRQISKRNATM